MTVLNKIIFKTAAWAFIWTAVAFSFGIGLFAFFCPGIMIDFADAVGNQSLSAKYYERVYKRNPTNENLYYTFAKYVDAKNYSKTIQYGKKFFIDLNPSDRTDIIDQVNAYLEVRATANNDVTALAFGCNEDNRLRCALIGALLKRNSNISSSEYQIAKSLFMQATDLLNFNPSYPSYAAVEFALVYRDEILTNHYEIYETFNEYYNEFLPDPDPTNYAEYFFYYNAQEIFMELIT